MEKEKESERNMEQELIEQINAKKQEQYLATWGLIYQSNGNLKDAEKDLKNAISNTTSNKVINLKPFQDRVEEEKRTMEITWHIAERNKNIYEPEILYLREKLRSIQTNDVVLMELVKCKHACFQLTGKYEATFTDIVDSVENYKYMIENGVEDPRLTYYKLLYLFDLPGDKYRKLIDECYQLALRQDVNIYNFIGAYERKILL